MLVNNVGEDTTPQLGGALDVNGNEISSASNNHVVINPNGSGTIKLNATATLEDGSHNFDVASHDGTNGLLLGGTLVTSSATELNKLDDYAVVLLTYKKWQIILVQLLNLMFQI